MTKTYIEWIYPGILFSETSSSEVKTRSKNRKFAKGAYGFRFFDREEVEQNGEILKGEPKNYSKIHIKGTAYTAEEAEKAFPDERILLSNIRINKMKGVIATKQGGFYEWDDNTEVIKE